MPYLGLFTLLVLIAALIDIVSTDDALIRGLPKVAWVLLVIVLPLVGALVWIGWGRPMAADRPRRGPSGAAADFPEYDRPGRYVPADPEADRAFLQSLRDRAEEQRRIAREEERRTREAEGGADA